MKYKVLAGTELHEKIGEWYERLKLAHDKMMDICKTIGADAYWRDGSGLFEAFNFADKKLRPGMQKAYRGGDPNVQRPRKDNQDLLGQIHGCGFPLRKDLNDLFGFKPVVIKDRYYSNVGVTYTPEYALVEVFENAPYIPVQDMIEITVSEWKTLKGDDE